MSAFDNSEYETARQQYEDEAKQRWGDTDAYKESQAKTADYSKDKWNDVLGGLNGVFAEFAACRNGGDSADSETAQRLVKKLQEYITAKFYHCTDDILAGLGQMYVCDERFKKNIDNHGEGTAEFVSKAIKIYSRKKPSISSRNAKASSATSRLARRSPTGSFWQRGSWSRSWTVWKRWKKCKK